MSASASTVNNLLTTYARGLAADALKKQALVDFICPPVETGMATGRYKLLDDKNSLVATDAKRGIGSHAKRLEFSASDGQYNCEPYSLEIPIDDHELRVAGDAGLELLKQGKTAALINTQVVSRENDVWTKLRAAVSATANVGVWSNAAKDPVAEIDAIIAGIATSLGVMPNRVVFGLGAWQVFRSHPLVMKRFPTTMFASLRPDQAAGLFLNPEVEVRIGTMPKDAAKAGAAKSAQNIVGNEVWVFYASPSTGVFDNSFAKCFRMRGDGVMSVREYRDESARSNILAIDWTEQPLVTRSDAGARITLS